MSHVLELHGVSVAHAADAPVLTDIHLPLARGFTGIVGANGAGKTTLLRVLSGTLAPTEGVVRRAREDLVLALVPQESPEVTPDVRALAEGSDGRAAEVRGRLGLDPDVLDRWPTLSPGERQRWAVGAALARDPDVLCLDEPTNHLDAPGRALLVGALRRFGGAGVVVSHDRALLDALCHTTVRLHAGRATVFAGGYGAALEAWTRERRAAEDAHAEARGAARAAASRLAEARRTHAEAIHATRTRARMKSVRDSDARNSLAKGRANAAEARAGRSVTVARAAAERAGEAVPRIERDRTAGAAVFAGFARAPKPVLFHVDQDEVRARRGDVVVLRDVRVTIGREDRVRLAGPNGAGKSTLLAALLASGPPPGRVLALGQELLPAETASHVASLRELDREERGRVLSVFASLGSDPSVEHGRLGGHLAPEDVARTLSPGEARKLALALGLGRHAWALVLDEPENHLDLPTVERLEAALALYPGCLVLVTHDDDLAASCTQRVLRVEGGAVV